MNEQQYKNYELAAQRSKVLAGDAVRALNLPVQINLMVDDVKHANHNEKLFLKIKFEFENLVENMVKNYRI